MIYWLRDLNPSPGNVFLRRLPATWDQMAPRHISSSRAHSDKIPMATPMLSGVKLSSSGTSNFVERRCVPEIQHGSQITKLHYILARHGRKSRTCRWNFDAICCSSSGNYFRFWWPYHYFRLSFDVIVTCWDFLRARPCRKLHVCHRSCNDICHTVGDISTSGLDGHIAIFGFSVVRQCRIYLWTLSLSLAWSKTLFTALELQ